MLYLSVVLVCFSLPPLLSLTRNINPSPRYPSLLPLARYPWLLLALEGRNRYYQGGISAILRLPTNPLLRMEQQRGRVLGEGGRGDSSIRSKHCKRIRYTGGTVASFLASVFCSVYVAFRSMSIKITKVKW